MNPLVVALGAFLAMFSLVAVLAFLFSSSSVPAELVECNRQGVEVLEYAGESSAAQLIGKSVVFRDRLAVCEAGSVKGPEVECVVAGGVLVQVTEFGCFVSDV
ncbi:MAG: hypothetical protein JW834_02265 [Candidatus Diapherotrites archaeon]|nr:hypothetical protein [Candidatus Diapherotrites archaeon]